MDWFFDTNNIRYFLKSPASKRGIEIARTTVIVDYNVRLPIAGGYKHPGYR